MKLSEDPEIARILAEPEGDTPRDHLEMLTVLSDQIMIAGSRFPAPTLGTHALLHLIRSPFIDSGGPPSDVNDLLNALFLLSEPQKAARLLLERARCENQFGNLLAQTDAFSDTDRREMKQGLQEEKMFQSRWKKAIRQFREKRNPPEGKQAATELYSCLEPGIGFSMLPQTGGPDRRQVVNLEVITGAAAGLTAVLPSLTMPQLLWELPVVAVGFLMVQTARKNGVAGISRNETTEKLWKRFRMLQTPAESAERTARPTGKKPEILRRHFRMLCQAADLKTIPVPPPDRVRKKSGKCPLSSVRLPIPPAEPHADSRPEEPRQEIRTPDAKWEKQRIPVPFSIPASRTESAGPAGPLHSLLNSVEHIENILRQQLPDSIV